MMYIGIDATIVRGDRVSGIERYVIELINHLGFVNKRDRFEIYCSKGGVKYFKSLPSNFKIIVSPFSNRILTEQIWLPNVCNKSKSELIHLTTLGPSFFIRKKSVITIHDVVPWKFKNTISAGMKYYYKPFLTHYVKHKKPKILTVSDSSKKDISQLFCIPYSDIYRVYIGKTDSFKRSPQTLINYVRQKYRLPKKYLLTIGTLEPRKNIKNLINAYESICDDIKESLVIVGRKGWERDLKINQEVKKRIIFTGFVKDDDLIPILSGATVFVFPSIYEGFGLPVIEAQSCGVPVIISSSSSLPEIAGKSAIYFNPLDPTDIGKKIRKVVNDKELQKKISEKGLLNAKNYSWIKTAEETNYIYQALIGD